MHADDAHQPLRQHGDQRRSEQVILHAHVDQARDGARGVVGVQGGEDQVAGQGGLDRDIGGFAVADFADHDHVRILAHDVAQPDANVRPICGLTWIWLMPSIWYSTGSSIVMILLSGS